ncbi:hypothetical protein Gpo141_00005069 [Globisporangium polare]
MAIPGVSMASNAAADGETPLQTKSSAAMHDRRVKLQHLLVMKAFNLRKERQTVSQQFQFLKKHDDNQSGRTYLELDQLCEYLSIPPFRRLVLCQVFQLTPSDKRLDFDVFVRFLQSTAVQAAEEEKELQRSFSASASGLPQPPPQSTPRASSHHGPTDGTGDSSQLVCFQPTWLSSQTRFSHPPPAPGLWKKREITIQERITEYTKIDEHGRPQHLIEKEKHQTEVIHMENLAGEFAHREITHFEQTEQLNDEIVHHEHGREEFVHLKSEHDEISRFESSIPTGGGSRPEECEQPPPSPTIKRDPSAMGDDHERTSFGGVGGQDHNSEPIDPEAMGMTEEEFYHYQNELDEQQQHQLQQQFEMESMQ